MPGRDRTGPRGLGPMSGGGLGLCGRAGSSRYDDVERFGRGGGRGWRHRCYATAAGGWTRTGRSGPWAAGPPYSAEIPGGAALTQLKDYAEALAAELSTIKTQLAELQKQLQTS